MSPTDHDNLEPQPVDRDLLISRVVDDAATARDWDQLRALAEYDPSVWRELFEAQHAQADLARAVEQAIAIADGIDAPTDALTGPSLRFRIRKVAGWTGWALAAGVAIAWMAPQLTPSRPTSPLGTPQPGGQALPLAVAGNNTSSQPSRVELVDPSQASGNPLLAGGPSRRASTSSAATPESTAHLVAEMPERTLLEVRPLPDGRLELIYVRKLIERAIVDDGDLYQVKPDDAGIDRTVPYRTRRPSSGPI